MRSAYNSHSTPYATMLSWNSVCAMRGMSSMCAASDTMPVAMTMPKYAGDIPVKPASALRPGGVSRGVSEMTRVVVIAGQPA